MGENDKLTGALDGIGKSEKKEKEVETAKRSYYLTDKQIKRVLLMNAEFRDKSMSEIVGEAINEYYEKRF